jgi:integrase
VRKFARHCAALDPATQIPPAGLLGRGSVRKSPHIYSDAEVSALLREAALVGPPGGLLSRTLVAIFSLMASTGLRVSEACRLAHRDVDLEQGVLVIRESKFRKSRLVPVHPTVAAALGRYASERDRIKPRSEFFFRTDRARRITRNTVERILIRLRPRLGWTCEGRARLPRAHDLRHTFAVRRLLLWYEEGADIDRKVLALSTYLGHTAPSYTYWYLSAVPELLAITSRRFEAFATRDERSAP